MEQKKRLSKTDYVIVYAIIFSLIAFVGGFFLGASTMKQNLTMELKAYQEQKLKEEELKKIQLQYPPTDFVSFYHSVYLPFDKFRTAYYTYFNHITQSSGNTGNLSIDIDLKSRAEETLATLKNTENFQASPDLQKAKNDYLKSLEAYIDSIAGRFDNQGKQEGIPLLEGESPGERYGLTGQLHFYRAIIQWEARQNGEKVDIDRLHQIDDLTEWNTLSFHQKNYVIASILESLPLAVPYNPEDITVHLDAAIKSGNGDMLGNLKKAVQLLQATDAVEKGDFLKQQNLYEHVTSPHLPLFSN
ncbi:MAG: hypothetical protein H0Z33_02070 [Bacillaceae bacterium]|nr:hypothetical protein [Bacillaceae bacterium]